MTQELTFKENSGQYVCQLDNYTQGVIVQLELASQGAVVISANLPDMPSAVVQIVENPYGNSVVFQIDLPEDVSVQLATSTKVIKAVCLS